MEEMIVRQLPIAFYHEVIASQHTENIFHTIFQPSLRCAADISITARRPPAAGGHMASSLHSQPIE
jgi:hypothetical protein